MRPNARGIPNGAPTRGAPTDFLRNRLSLLISITVPIHAKYSTGYARNKHKDKHQADENEPAHTDPNQVPKGSQKGCAAQYYGSSQYEEHRYSDQPGRFVLR